MERGPFWVAGEARKDAARAGRGGKMGLFMMEEFNDSQDTVSCQREQLAGRNTPLANMLCGSISGIQPSSSMLEV